MENLFKFLKWNFHRLEIQIELNLSLRKNELVIQVVG